MRTKGLLFYLQRLHLQLLIPFGEGGDKYKIAPFQSLILMIRSKWPTENRYFSESSSCLYYLWNLEPGTWNLEPGTWNLELETWNLELWNFETLN